MIVILSLLGLLPGLAPSAVLAGPRPSQASQAPQVASVEGRLEDRILAPFQLELLDLAFGAATALPLHPHVKNRSRAQERVVEACLELEQPRRALGYIEQIENWRRGAAYAELASHCAERGAPGEAQRYLELAGRTVEGPASEEEQEWRRDRVRVKIARVEAELGRGERVAELEAAVSESERGQLQVVRAMLAPPQEFEARLAALTAQLEGVAGSLDDARGALDACAEFYRRFYGDEARRLSLEQTLRACGKKVPLQMHLELVLEFVGVALENQDQARALTLLAEAESLLARARWGPADRIPLSARMAELFFRAGDTAKARATADLALGSFETERADIVDIYRAGILRPLAEAFHAMGDTATALVLYKRAVEEGILNPNSRPRAEDLSATCCSMALRGIEPDEHLRSRLARIRAELGEPW